INRVQGCGDSTWRRAPRTFAPRSRVVFNAFAETAADENATVNDAGREFRGLAAIKKWSDREIMDAQVRFDVLDIAQSNDEVTVTTKVDGNFDRTGLPDPVIISHHITAAGDKIVGLTCRL